MIYFLASKYGSLFAVEGLVVQTGGQLQATWLIDELQLFTRLKLTLQDSGWKRCLVYQ